MSFKSAATEIGVILNEVSTDSGLFDVILPYHTSNPEGFPAVSYEFEALNPNEIFTNQEDNRTFVFKVIAYQAVQKVGRAKAVELLQDVVDVLVDGFDKNPTLNGVSENVVPSVGQKGELEGTNGTTLVFELNLAVEIVKFLDINC